MHFSFHPKGNWSLLNERATELFGVNEMRNQVRVYANPAQAVLESALGFYQQFPLKKKFFYFKNLDPHFDLAITALSKMGLQAKALAIEDMVKPEAWQDQLDREAGVFLYSYDNPITGALHSTSELDRVLKDKAIFRITLSHASYLLPAQVVAASSSSKSSKDIDRNEIVIHATPLSSANGVAVAYVGERGRFGSITAEASSPCSLETLEKIKTWFDQTTTQAIEVAKKITDYEQAMIAEFTLLRPAHRTQDRIIIILDDIDGYGFLDELAKADGEVLKTPGLDPRFEAASLTRWGGLKTMDWLKSHHLDSKQIRGLVVLLPEYFIKHTPVELKAKLTATKSQLYRLQNGDGAVNP